jgi:small ubiquitin-related modifier
LFPPKVEQNRGDSLTAMFDWIPEERQKNCFGFSRVIVAIQTLWVLLFVSRVPFLLKDISYNCFTECDLTPFKTGEETFFKIKKTTKMSKVFDTYATRRGVQPSSLRFMLDGERIDPNTTPKMLEMDDQDQIDCMLEQTGGSCRFS